jgi:hypothetical protein
MQPQNKYQKYLSIFLWLIGVHSFAVGIGLIFIPPSFLSNFGFVNYTESFFQAQGGVFHIAMSIAYVIAGRNVVNSSQLIRFIVIVKFLAFVFLMLYFFFILNSWIILLSGIADGLMGVVVLTLHKLKERAT